MSYPPRNEEQSDEKFAFPFSHGSTTATTTIKVWRAPANRPFVIDRITYINVTGLAEDTANNFAGAIKNDGNLVADLFNTDSDLDPDTGASLAANTWVEPATLTNRRVEGGDDITLVLTETGTATLPAGSGLIEGRYV